MLFDSMIQIINGLIQPGNVFLYVIVEAFICAL